jgi:hypothetical protein
MVAVGDVVHELPVAQGGKVEKKGSDAGAAAFASTTPPIHQHRAIAACIDELLRLETQIIEASVICVHQARKPAWPMNMPDPGSAAKSRNSKSGPRSWRNPSRSPPFRARIPETHDFHIVLGHRPTYRGQGQRRSTEEGRRPTGPRRR